MNKTTKILKGDIKGEQIRLGFSDDAGRWVTNGHWMIRQECLDERFATPETIRAVFSPQGFEQDGPDVTSMLRQRSEQKTQRYSPTTIRLQVKGCRKLDELVRVYRGWEDGRLVCLSEQYVRMLFAETAEDLYGPLLDDDSVMFLSDAPKAADITRAVMPVNANARAVLESALQVVAAV